MKGSTPDILPNKGLGQHFLIDKNIARKIIRRSFIAPSDTIIELGTGIGALTDHLVRHARKVIGIEIDERAITALQEKGYKNLKLIRGDMLRVSFNALLEEINAPLKIISNLPYNISGPLLSKIYDEQEAVNDCVFMVQKEVGERLIADKGSREYGVLTVLLGSIFSIKRLFLVPASAFYPRPRVESMVIRLTRHSGQDIMPCKNSPCVNTSYFKRIVRSAFQKRRKKIKNALSPPFDADRLESALKEAGIDPSMRPEQISVQEYKILVSALVSLSEMAAPRLQTTKNTAIRQRL